MPSIYELARLKSEALLLQNTEKTGAEKIKKAKQARGKKYREKYHDKTLAYSAKYREKHREEIRQRNAETKEQRASWWQEYYQKNKEQLLAKQKARRTAKRINKDPQYLANQLARQNRYLEKLKQDPVRYQEYLARRREYRKNKCQKTSTKSSPPPTPATPNSSPGQSK